MTTKWISDEWPCFSSLIERVPRSVQWVAYDTYKVVVQRQASVTSQYIPAHCLATSQRSLLLAHISVQGTLVFSHRPIVFSANLHSECLREHCCRRVLSIVTLLRVIQRSNSTSLSTTPSIVILSKVRTRDAHMRAAQTQSSARHDRPTEIRNSLLLLLQQRDVWLPWRPSTQSQVVLFNDHDSFVSTSPSSGISTAPTSGHEIYLNLMHLLKIVLIVSQLILQVHTWINTGMNSLH